MDKGLENWDTFLKRSEKRASQKDITAVNKQISEAEIVEEDTGGDPYNTGNFRMPTIPRPAR